MTTVTAKLPVLSKKDTKAIRARLRKGINIPIEELDDEELLAVVEDGHVLSGITKQEIENWKIFAEEVRHLYKANDGVRVWINGVVRMRKFVEDC